MQRAYFICSIYLMIRTQLIEKLHQHLQMNKFYVALCVAQPPIVNIVLTMLGISNSNKTRYQVGCQSRTNACI